MLVFYTSVNCQLGPWKFPFRKRFLFSISNLFKANKTNKQQTKGKRDEFFRSQFRRSNFPCSRELNKLGTVLLGI